MKKLLTNYNGIWNLLRKKSDFFNAVLTTRPPFGQHLLIYGLPWRRDKKTAGISLLPTD
jgi:hypothetical protein